MEVQSTGYDACDHSIISQISDDVALTRVSIDNPTHDNLPGTSARLRENRKQNLAVAKNRFQRKIGITSVQNRHIAPI
jgi:hypothetical protein